MHLIAPAATIAVLALSAILPARTQAQNPPSEELSRWVSDFTVAACLNERGRTPPGAQAGSCTKVIESFGLGPKALAVVHVLRGYARETMAKREDELRESRRLIDLSFGSGSRPVGADERDKASLDRSRKNKDLAIADYATAIQLDAQLAWREFNRGVQGELDPLTQGEALYASHFYGRGVAALRLGRVEEGKADIARAIQMDPGIGENFAQHEIKP